MRLVRADTLWKRARGLGFRRDMPVAEALLIPRCRSVHTFTMRFPLDLIWLDAGGDVIRVDRGVRPGRLRCCRGARAVVECRDADRLLLRSGPRQVIEDEPVELRDGEGDLTAPGRVDGPLLDELLTDRSCR